ncbi:hypothetical protein CB0940_10840 [Cercospora beticola]|uniref:Uncharacterized protein n=1 Tax=Cercospora beticola TaxID=122368 RepID=A0A2G5HSS8_CERBT|nr:hypothetical protein CB0940_10840 [Cercospora beticola]PIA95594.1 hypothetical protein CB0940_10840 [Cercospora beticola]WPB07572.1 hypothetical protein RHO25_012233 [Cercospora beticola]
MQGANLDELTNMPDHSRAQTNTSFPEEDVAPRTPEEYAKCVAAFALLRGLYHGEDYQHLGDFMMRPIGPRLHRPTSVNDENPALLRPPIIYRWSPNTELRRKHVKTVAEVSQEVDDLVGKHGSMLFLSGLQKPDWINAIGAGLDLDPRFFHDHLHIKPPIGARTLFSMPALPSANDSIVRLRYFTIGEHTALPSGTKLSRLRSMGSKAMEQYRRALNSEHNSKQGDSIVRLHYVHSLEYFSIMQQMTIAVHSTGNGFKGVAWIDSGHDLDQGPDGPWSNSAHSWRPRFLPTALHAPRIALEWQHCATLPQSTGLLMQTASHLCENYGRSLDDEILCQDAFYAISDLLQYAAASICQYLNLLDYTVRNATIHATSKAGNFDVSDLAYHRQSLDDVISVLKENLRAVQARGHPAWPQAAVGERLNEADRIAASLLVDYQELLSRAQTLAERCSSDMRNIMHQAAIAESQRSFVQAEKVGQLTWLAFLFVPLTFTTSFLGMNLEVFGQGTIPFWVWFTITPPLVMFAFFMPRLARQDWKGNKTARPAAKPDPHPGSQEAQQMRHSV